MRKLHRQLALACAAGVCTTSLALSADRTWVAGAGGTFQNPANWAGALIPGPLDRALFDTTNIGASYQVALGNFTAIDSMVVNDPLTFELAGLVLQLGNATDSILVSNDGQESRRLSVANGTLTAAGAIKVGNSSGFTGGLELQNVALQITSSQPISLGHAVGATGTMVVNNSSVNVNQIAVGLSGTGRLEVLGGSTVTVNFLTANDGRLVFTGGQTTVANTSNYASGNNTEFYVQGGLLDLNGLSGYSFGSSGGNGLVQVSSGTLSVTSLRMGSSNGSASLIVDATGDGRVVVDSSLIIGDSGHGTLVVNQAARVNAASLAVGNTGVGTAIFTNGGSGTFTSHIRIGGSGSGLMDLATSARVSTSGSVSIGRTAGSIGTLNVRGNGSTFSSGSIVVGDSGWGTMRLLDGAVGTTGFMMVGASADGTGSLLVSGPGAVLNVAGIEVAASSLATGAVEIGHGAALVSSGSVVVNSGGGIAISGGRLAGASLVRNGTGVIGFEAGTIQITGAGGINIAPTGPLGEQLLLDTGKALDASTLNITANALVAMRGGRLSGNGSISPGGQLLLQDPASIVSGNFTNAGRIQGSGTIFGSLSNQTVGEVRAALGERLAFSTTGSNAGQINLVGGEVEFGGTLSNTTTGRISGRGLLRAASTDNAGTAGFSAGVSDVFGAFNNVGSGKTIVSGLANVTFWDSVSNAVGSEFRVSAGAAATFFGSVTGLSQFTGSGTTIFEGPASLGRIGKTGATRVGPFGDLSADHVRDGRLQIEGSVAIVPDGADAGASRVETLFIDAGGRLDLSNNAMVIDYDVGSPRVTIGGYVQQGHNAGAWNGPGINSSLAAVTPNRAIGYADAADIGSPAMFSGQPSDSTSVLLRYTLPGDANLDRLVNIGDFSLLAASFNQPSYWARGDFNYDGVTAIGDFALLAANFNQSLPADSARSASVPEPAGFGLALLLGAHVIRSRRASR